MNINAFLNTLPIMGKGMLGIFVVAAILVFTMYLIRMLGNKK